MRFLLSLLVLTLSSPLVSVSAAGNVGDACCTSNLCTTQISCNDGLSCCNQRPGWMEYLGGTCYDPKTSTCASCPVYNPNHPESQICPNSTPKCCASSNGQHTCCDKDQSTCPSGTQTCGTSCYQPKDYVCADSSHSVLCPVSNPSLCGDACYNEAQYTCVDGALQQISGNPTTGSTTAPTSASTPAPGCVLPGDLKCGQRCYSPQTHVCADAGSSFLCPLAYPLACGDACYSSTQYKCVNGKLQGL